MYSIRDRLSYSIIAGMIGLILAAPALAILLDTKRELATAGFFDES